MSTFRVGTDVVGGLNVALAAHKIGDNELTVSENGWHDEDGVWRVAKGPETLYSGYTNIRAFAAGRMGGEDHLVWLDGTTLYDNGVNKGTVAATGDDVQIKDFDDKFFIFGNDLATNMIYDGDHIREHGTWQPDTSYIPDVVDIVANAGLSITNVDEGSPTVFTVGAHSWSVGDKVYISGMTGLDEMEARQFTISDTNDPTNTTFSVAEDSTDYVAWSSGGTAYNSACAYGNGTAKYKYYYTCTLELKDGTVLEGAPKLIPPSAEDKNTDGESISPNAIDDVSITISPHWAVGGTDQFSITGTRGTDYKPGVRVYRTKADGADFYLEKDFQHGDSELSYNSTYGYYTLAGLGNDSYTLDGDLGAVYTPGMNDHKNAPQSSHMHIVGQRIFLNDVDNASRVYYTHLDGVEYVPTLNNLTIPDDVTGIGGAGPVGIIKSADRQWRMSLLGGVPDMDEIITDVGLDDGDPMYMSAGGLLSLRGDGLYAEDGASPPRKIARRAAQAVSGPSAITGYGDTLYMSGTSRAYVGRRTENGVQWHESRHVYQMADATNGEIYAADANRIYKLFQEEPRGGALETKHYAVDREVSPKQVILDVEGGTQPEVWLNGNRISDWQGHTDYSDDADGGRRLVTLKVPANRRNHVFWVRVEMSGDGAVYGVWAEVSG